MKNFSEDEIKEIINENTSENNDDATDDIIDEVKSETADEDTAKEKKPDRNLFAIIAAGVALVGIILAVSIPICTLGNSKTPEAGSTTTGKTETTTSDVGDITTTGTSGGASDTTTTEKPDATTDGTTTSTTVTTTAPEDNSEIKEYEGFLYRIDDGYATITGYTDKSESLNMPEEIDGMAVKHIADKAFSDAKHLVKITIPDSVETIGDECFMNCTHLVEIVLPESVTSVGKGAFMGCLKLERADLSDNITDIPESLFSGCLVLSRIVIPKNLVSIGADAFYECTSITKLEFPESLRKVSVDGTFFGCYNLTELIFSEGFEEFDYPTHETVKAMLLPYIERIYLPSTFKDEKVGWPLFDCGHAVEISEDNPMFTVFDDNIVSKDKTHLYCLYTIGQGSHAGSTENYYYIPDCIKTASEYTFKFIYEGRGIVVSKDFVIPESVSHYNFIYENFCSAVDKAGKAFYYEVLNHVTDELNKLKETDPRFSFENTFSERSLRFYPIEGKDAVMAHFSEGYVSYLEQKNQYYVYAYPIEDKADFSSESEGYIVIPETFSYEGVGEYGISITTNSDKTEFVESTDFIDYFLYDYLYDYTSENDVINNEIRNIIHNNILPELPLEEVLFGYSVDYLHINEKNKETLISGNCSINKALLDVNFEVYPSGYYGFNDEKVFKTPDGKFYYSVRVIDVKWNKFYYK